VKESPSPSRILGNYTVGASASPMLVDVIIEASKMVSDMMLICLLHRKSQVPSAYDPPGMTVYDKWMKVHRNNATNEPK
jgi:hypothetical protein